MTKKMELMTISQWAYLPWASLSSHCWSSLILALQMSFADDRFRPSVLCILVPRAHLPENMAMVCFYNPHLVTLTYQEPSYNPCSATIETSKTLNKESLLNISTKMRGNIHSNNSITQSIWDKVVSNLLKLGTRNNVVRRQFTEINCDKGSWCDFWHLLSGERCHRIEWILLQCHAEEQPCDALLPSAFICLFASKMIKIHTFKN